MKNRKQYNFDTNELINSFNFDDFILKGSKAKYNNSAVLLITNKQYILSWTSNFGMGFHYSTLAQIYKDIHDGGRIESSIEEFKLENKVSKFMHAKLFFLNNSGAMLFYGLESINYKNYKIFLKFYNDFNETIKKVCMNNDFKISFKDKTINKYVSSKSLDKVLEYIQKNLDFNKKTIDDSDEKVIGITDRKNEKMV